MNRQNIASILRVWYGLAWIERYCYDTIGSEEPAAICTVLHAAGICSTYGRDLMSSSRRALKCAVPCPIQDIVRTILGRDGGWSRNRCLALHGPQQQHNATPGFSTARLQAHHWHSITLTSRYSSMVTPASAPLHHQQHSISATSQQHRCNTATVQ